MSDYMSDYEREDMELAAMMGDQFIDETVPQADMPELERKSANTTHHENKAEKTMDAQWEPIKQRNWMDDLKDCTKSTLLFGGLNVLIWWWQMAGLMDESIAQPCMWVCFTLAGIGVGKVLRDKR